MSPQDTPLQHATMVCAVLRTYGIRETDHHKHVGENGTRCAFCEKPAWAKIHDPERLGRGEE